MNILDDSPLPYVNCESVYYDAIISFITKNFLLDRVGKNYCSTAVCYILGHTLKKYFGKAMKIEKYIWDRRLLLDSEHFIVMQLLKISEIHALSLLTLYCLLA